MFRLYSQLPPGYITKSTIKILTSGVILFVGIETITLNEKFYEKQLMPLVHRFIDPEDSHLLAVKMAKYGILTSSKKTCLSYPELESTVFGRKFLNPIGIAAGFDKNGEAITSLRQSGVGFVEIGSVTPLPQSGNEKPRVFRLINDKAVINRYGFNNDGVGVVNERVRKAYDPTSLVPLGVNLGKNKESKDAVNDYEIGASYFAPHCDYLVVNVSSPNTPGLRALQSKNELIKILKTVKNAITRVTEFEGENLNKESRPKLLLKIAPDLSAEERKDIAKICLDKSYGIDGLIVSNTTISRSDSLQSSMDECKQTGGLSGEPLRKLSTECVSDMYRLTSGKIPIIGCGGVSSGKDAYEKIRAGASLIQFYTALVYQGFPITGRLKRELVECLRKDGFKNVSEAVGADHRSSIKK